MIAATSMHLLAWTLINFLWQGTAIAALLYLAIVFCRSARVRYRLSVAALVLMALTLVVTFVILQSTPQVSAQLAGDTRELHSLVAGSLGYLTPPRPEVAGPVDFLSGFLWFWCGGVLIFSIRALGGWLVVGRVLRTRHEGLGEALLERCRLLEKRLELKRHIRYAQSRLADTPTVVGWFRPLILIPASALTGLSPEQLQAVIVHELAHIQRLDCFVNLFQIAAETFLFYHPAVWWVNRVIRIEREHCCDDVALALCGNPIEYARALTLLEGSRKAVPTWAMAANGGNLRSRVTRLLGSRTIGRSVSTPGLAVAGLLCAAVVMAAATAFHGGSSLSENAPPEPQEISVPAAPASPAAPGPLPVPPKPAPAAKPIPRVGPLMVKPAEPPRPPEPLALESPTPLAAPAPLTPPSPVEPPVPAEPAAVAEESASGSYIEDLRTLGLKDLSVDQLIALKVQGLSPAYIREIRAAGLDPNVNDLIAMKVQGVDPKYVADIRATGLKPSLHDLIGMKVQGITPEYIRYLQTAGLGELKTHDFIAAKVQGITPEFIKNVKSHGFKDLTLHQLLALKVTGIF